MPLNYIILLDSNLSSEGSSSGSAVDTSDDDMEVSDEEKDEESVSGGESVNNTYSDFLSNVTPGLGEAILTPFNMWASLNLKYLSLPLFVQEDLMRL